MGIGVLGRVRDVVSAAAELLLAEPSTVRQTVSHVGVKFGGHRVHLTDREPSAAEARARRAITWTSVVARRCEVAHLASSAGPAPTSTTLCPFHRRMTSTATIPSGDGRFCPALPRGEGRLRSALARRSSGSGRGRRVVSSAITSTGPNPASAYERSDRPGAEHAAGCSHRWRRASSELSRRWYSSWIARQTTSRLNLSRARACPAPPSRATRAGSAA